VDAAVAAAVTALGAEARAMPVRALHVTSRRAALATYPLPAEDGVNIDQQNEVIVARISNLVYALVLACPHQNTALRWNATLRRFQCPKHHSQYQQDGTFIDGRAKRSMDRFAVRRDGNNLVVDLDKVFEQDRDASGWNAARLSI
jgi:nitrite reductase/ring-hydroxylating ferredoxin subunit